MHGLPAQTVLLSGRCSGRSKPLPVPSSPGPLASYIEPSCAIVILCRTGPKLHSVQACLLQLLLVLQAQVVEGDVHVCHILANVPVLLRSLQLNLWRAQCTAHRQPGTVSTT